MRKKNVLSVIVSVIALVFGFVPYNQSIHAQENTVQGNYASVNGLNIYYEIYGTGQPLILLHGGFGGIVEFSQLLPLLADTSAQALQVGRADRQVG